MLPLFSAGEKERTEDIVSFEKNVYINGLPMLGVIKCLDFGSSVTGTPYPLFTPILKALKRNIDQVYMRFIGLK